MDCGPISSHILFSSHHLLRLFLPPWFSLRSNSTRALYRSRRTLANSHSRNPCLNGGGRPEPRAVLIRSEVWLRFRMRNRGERTLKELYDVSERIKEPEITPVLEGNCRIQGPVDALDHELCKASSGTFTAEKKFAFTDKTLHMRVESGTCNVCSAPCSSCMHIKQKVLAMESTAECGSSYVTCATKEADNCSYIYAEGMPSYKRRSCDDMKREASEASNLDSASSSHDSYSKNAESRATVRPSITCEASDSVDKPCFLPTRETVKEQFVQERKRVLDDCLFSSGSYIASNSCHRTSPKEDEDQHGSECHEDNISHVARIKDSNVKVGHQNVELGKKIVVSTGPVAANTFLSREVEHTVQIEASNSFSSSKNEERPNFNGSQVTCTTGPFRRKCADSAICACSSKSQSPCSPLRNVCYHGDGNHSSRSSSSQHLVDGESSLQSQLAVGTSVVETKPPSSNHRSCEESSNANGFLADVVKITNPCLEHEKGINKEISSDTDMKFAGVNQKSEVAGTVMSASNMKEPEMKPLQILEDVNSEHELIDVKVCDICGDVGREELLAFCSRCSEGAEHIYCMRVMVHEVPEGDWLCEECQLKDAVERKNMDRSTKVSGNGREKESRFDEDDGDKVDRPEKIPGTEKEHKIKVYNKVGMVDKLDGASKISKEYKLNADFENKSVDKSERVLGTCWNETSQKFATKSISKLMPKLDMKEIDPDRRRAPKELLIPRTSDKRHTVIQEVMPLKSKKPQEVMPLKSKKPPDISAECIEIGTLQKKFAPSRESSFENLDAVKAREANMASSNGCKSANGSLVFSRSQSMLGSCSSKDQAQLQPPHRLLSRSSSFSNVNLKSKVRQPGQLFSVNTKITLESLLNDTRKKALGKSMTKSTSFKGISFDSFNTVPACNSQCIRGAEDSRYLKQVKKRNIIEKKSSSRPEGCPTNKSPRAGTSVPLLKMDTKIALHDIKLSNADGLGKNEANKQLTYSSKIVGSVPYKSYGNVETVQCQGVLKSAALHCQEDKAKGVSIFSGSKQVVSGVDRTLHCQKSNETGHATQFCSIDEVRPSARKPSAGKYSRVGNKKGSESKSALNVAISSGTSQRSNKQSDQSGEFHASRANGVDSKGLPSSSLKYPENLSIVVETCVGQEIPLSSDADVIKTAQVSNVGLKSFQPVEALCTSRDAETIEASCSSEINLNATDVVSDELNANHLLHLSFDQASMPTNPCIASAIPEIDYIWQGSFEVRATGEQSASFDGIQAHLSMSASPRALEVATKLPCRVQLEEVSCIRSWPLQFCGISPNEHNIALFFFAKDVESYERSYGKLLEKMFQHDLSLRGSIEGVELLIFPSTKLPMHSQRWNTLFFLWGIFKEMIADRTTVKPSFQKNLSGSPLNMDPMVQEPPRALRSVVSDSQKAVSVEVSENKSPQSDISSKGEALESAVRVQICPISSPEVEDGMCRAQDSSLVQLQSAVSSRLQSEQDGYTFPANQPSSGQNHVSNLLDTHPKSRFQLNNTQPCGDLKNHDAYLKSFGQDCVGRHALNLSAHTYATSLSAHASATNEPIGLSRTRSLSSTSEDCRKGSEVSSGKMPRQKETSMKNEIIFYDDQQENLKGINRLHCENRLNAKQVHACSEDERECKRMCLSEESLSMMASSEVHPLFGNLLNEHHRESKEQEEIVFFPLEPSRVQRAKSENVIRVLPSDDQVSESNTTNLELGLGGRWKTKKGSMDNDDDVSASLSLSLAIPSPKPMLKLERDLQERPDVSTALHLFGGFTDT